MRNAHNPAATRADGALPLVCVNGASDDAAMVLAEAVPNVVGTDGRTPPLHLAAAWSAELYWRRLGVSTEWAKRRPSTPKATNIFLVVAVIGACIYSAKPSFRPPLTLGGSDARIPLRVGESHRSVALQSASGVAADQYRCRWISPPEPYLFITGFRGAPTDPSAIHHMSLKACKRHVVGGDENNHACARWEIRCAEPLAGFEAMTKAAAPVAGSFTKLCEGCAFVVGQQTATPDLSLEVHNNRPLVEDSSGFELTVFDGGATVTKKMMSLLVSGAGINGKGFEVPPQKEAWTVRGRMTITHELIRRHGGDPGARLHIYLLHLHYHALGRRITMTHHPADRGRPSTVFGVRDEGALGSDRGTIVFDEGTPAILGGIGIGDRIDVACIYNSTSRQEPTLEGASYKAEMCNGFIMAYQHCEDCDPRTCPWRTSADSNP